MKQFNSTSINFLLLMLIFSGCSSAQKLETKAPFDFDEVYCQKWVAGIKEGGSGINLVISLSNELSQNVQMDSVYFRGKGALLEKSEGNIAQYVGHFKTNLNEKEDAFISSESNKEDFKQAPIFQQKIWYQLKDSECVISYREENITKYFKIENIVEKQSQNYPSAPNRHD